MAFTALHNLTSQPSLIPFQEYMLCKAELKDPRKCLQEGKAVTSCAMDFFRKVKKTCSEEFAQYANCLDKSSGDLHFKQ